jgi:hypothetical protein
VGEFRVENAGFGYRCRKLEEETLPAPVDSKDLFREASSLPNSDDLLVNFGRFLHHHRNKLVHHSQGSLAVKTVVKRDSREEWKDSSTEGFREFLVELQRALGVTTSDPSGASPSEIATLLKKALLTIESGKAPDIETRTVLESFDGYVDSIDGDTAYVTLESRENGDVLYGEYSASELLAKGIREQTRFLCETVKGGDGGRVHFAPLPKNQVTDEEARSIAKEMREAFPGDDDSVIEY